MRLKPSVVFLIFTFFSVPLSAENPWSYSLGVSGLDLTWTDEDTGTLVQEQVFGLDIRGSSIGTPTGFYYGSYISIGRPVVHWVYDDSSDTVTMDSSRYDMYFSFGLPFGYRWQMSRLSSYFYLGLGPSFQGLVDFDNHLWGSGNIFWEFGFETLKTKGVAFSMGGRVIIPITSFVSDGSYTAEAADRAASVFFLGMSWRGQRGY